MEIDESVRLAGAGLTRRSGGCFAVGGLVRALSAVSWILQVTQLALLLGTASSPSLDGRGPADDGW